jgi:hypothetical protein
MHPATDACTIAARTEMRVFDGRAAAHEFVGRDGVLATYAWTFDVVSWSAGTTTWDRPARLTVWVRERRENPLQRVVRRFRGSDAGDCSDLALPVRFRRGGVYRVRAGRTGPGDHWWTDSPGALVLVR